MFRLTSLNILNFDDYIYVGATPYFVGPHSYAKEGDMIIDDYEEVPFFEDVYEEHKVMYIDEDDMPEDIIMFQ